MLYSWTASLKSLKWNQQSNYSVPFEKENEPTIGRRDNIFSRLNVLIAFNKFSVCFAQWQEIPFRKGYDWLLYHHLVYPEGLSCNNLLYKVSGNMIKIVNWPPRKGIDFTFQLLMK